MDLKVDPAGEACGLNDLEAALDRRFLYPVVQYGLYMIHGLEQALRTVRTWLHSSRSRW